jgi:hypothetical protein
MVALCSLTLQFDRAYPPYFTYGTESGGSSIKAVPDKRVERLRQRAKGNCRSLQGFNLPQDVGLCQRLSSAL